MKRGREKIERMKERDRHTSYSDKGEEKEIKDVKTIAFHLSYPLGFLFHLIFRELVQF